jgi:hypothetical protein
MPKERHIKLCEVYVDILEIVCTKIVCIFLGLFLLGSEVFLLNTSTV